jgi:hypothetical protein
MVIIAQHHFVWFATSGKAVVTDCTGISIVTAITIGRENTACIR